MGTFWNESELYQAAMDIVESRFLGMEEWSDDQLRCLIAMAIVLLRERGHGGKGREAKGESH